jgi:anti-anti-sigma regulatory factor
MTQQNGAAELLPPSLDLLGAKPLCQQLPAKVLSAEPILLDGSRVERISTPCIQILVAALKSAEARGTPFRLSNPSTALAEALVDLGLQQVFARQET